MKLERDSQASSTSECGDGERARILWAGDHTECVRSLLSEHYDVVAVANGVEALAAIDSARPDLVLTDVMLPEMDAGRLLRVLRADERTRDIPVILLSAQPGEEALLGDLELGAEDYLLKPFVASELLARVRTHLKLARARRALTVELERKMEARTLELVRAGQTLQTMLNDATDARVALEQTMQERQRALDDLRDSEEKLRQLAAALQEAFALFDAATSAVLYVSPAYERIWGRPCQSLYERPESWVISIAESDRQRVMQAMERTRIAGDAFEEEYQIRLPDGRLRWIRSRAFPVRDGSGRVVRIAAAAEDITQRKTAELARDNLEWQLRQSQKLEALGTLTSGIAHDFNNLLGVILGSCELLEHEQPVQDSSNALELVNEIGAAGVRARDLVKRLLNFGRPKLQQSTAVDLQLVLTDVVKLLRATLPAGVELTLQAAAAVHKVQADETLIHQVVLNLATNAWQSLQGQPGRVVMSLEACRVDSSVEGAQPSLEPGAYVRLSVRDNGCGIDAANLDRIFEPFFTTKTPGGGTGLGLSVVHGIVRSLGGAIVVDSERGRGSTFHVYLPASSAAVECAGSANAGTQKVRAEAGHVLLVDDEPALVKIAAAHLKRLGYGVEAHTRPSAALEAFKADPARFDLIITDYNMPQMSGIDLAEQLMRVKSDAVIALISGNMRSNEVERARAAGIREILAKPFSFNDLNLVLRRLLNPRRE